VQAIPQATDELRAKWGGDMGVGEDKAMKFLAERGWREIGNGMMLAPPGERTQDEWEALDFLCQEWDFGYAGQGESAGKAT